MKVGKNTKKFVVAGVIALGVVLAVSTFASGPESKDNLTSGSFTEAKKAIPDGGNFDIKATINDGKKKHSYGGATVSISSTSPGAQCYFRGLRKPNAQGGIIGQNAPGGEVTVGKDGSLLIRCAKGTYTIKAASKHVDGKRVGCKTDSNKVTRCEDTITIIDKAGPTDTRREAISPHGSKFIYFNYERSEKHLGPTTERPVGTSGAALGGGTD